MNRYITKYNENKRNRRSAKKYDFRNFRFRESFLYWKNLNNYFKRLQLAVFIVKIKKKKKTNENFLITLSRFQRLR